MDVLCTGGFGFLGTHLVEELLEDDPTVNIHIVDDLSSNIMDHEEFLDLIGNPRNVSYDIITVKEYLKVSNREFEQIYHLASVVGPAGVLPHSGHIANSIISDTHLLGVRTMLTGARLVDVSTSELYGGGTSAEEDNKIISSHVSARLEYAVGKLAAELSLVNLSKTAGLDAVIVRPFNIAGARQSPAGGFVLPRFCHQALKGEPLTIFGDGQQIRAFTHVKDVAKGLRLAMQRGLTGEAYNIGNPINTTTIVNLAVKVIELAGSPSVINCIDPKDIHGALYAEANDKIPNATKAHLELGWQSKLTIDDIINDALEWERSQ